MTTAPTQTPPDAPRSGGGRPRWLAPALAVGAVAFAVGMWLFQPWLLFVDTEVDETLPTISSAPAAGADDDAMASDDDAMAEGDDAMAEGDDAMAEEPVPGPVVLASGPFTSRDHETTGTASLVQLEDGSLVVTLEDFSTSNGPDLYVYLDDDPADAPALAFDDGLDLGALRGNVGNLVYAVPADADLTGLDTVVIWCDRFSHVFGAADLVPTGS